MSRTIVLIAAENTSWKDTRTSYRNKIMGSTSRKIIFQDNLCEKLLSLCVNALPDKAYGIVAGRDGYLNQDNPSRNNRSGSRIELAAQGKRAVQEPLKIQTEYKAEEIYPLHTNLRPENEKINSIFLSYGEFYCDKDRGFWIDKREQFEIMKDIAKKGQKIIAIYHSHRCRLATPSQVDIDLHYDPDALALIVSLVDPQNPEMKAFEITNKRYREAEIVVHSSEKNPLKK